MNTLQLAEAKRFLLKEIGDNPYHFSLDPSSDDYGGPTYVFSTLSDKGKDPTRYFVSVEDMSEMEDPFPEIKNVDSYNNDDDDEDDYDDTYDDDYYDEEDDDVNRVRLPTLNVSFGAGPTVDNTDTSGLTNKGEALRVMATVMAIIRLEFNKHPNTQILSFVPSNIDDKYRDKNYDDDDGITNTRGRVYLGYIKNEFKDGISEGLVKIKIDEDEYIIKFDRDYLDKYLSTKS